MLAYDALRMLGCPVDIGEGNATLRQVVMEWAHQAQEKLEKFSELVKEAGGKVELP